MQHNKPKYNNQQNYLLAATGTKTFAAYEIHSYRIVSTGSVKIKIGDDAEITLLTGDSPAVAFDGKNSRAILITSVDADTMIYTTK